jgi:hypothetical protein
MQTYKVETVLKQSGTVSGYNCPYMPLGDREGRTEGQAVSQETLGPRVIPASPVLYAKLYTGWLL